MDGCQLEMDQIPGLGIYDGWREEGHKQLAVYRWVGWVKGFSLLMIYSKLMMARWVIGMTVEVDMMWRGYLGCCWWR